MEFIVCKKNIYNLRQDLEREKIKNENIGLELMNLVNEHQEVQKTIKKGVSQSDESNEGKKFLEKKIQRLQEELDDTMGALQQSRQEA